MSYIHACNIQCLSPTCVEYTPTRRIEKKTRERKEGEYPREMTQQRGGGEEWGGGRGERGTESEGDRGKLKNPITNRGGRRDMTNERTKTQC